ncbi:MAG: class I SAM-dependent methyltransferase [Alphaproteobacteria bacterium]|nr:class I SAM-dependent methyltransferase [Alphaproteobacteria bacterium]
MSRNAAEIAAEQLAFWNGPGGQGWLASYGRIERAIAEVGAVALAAAAARPGEQAIDIGCGTGGTTAALAKAVAPDGHVLGVDISQALIDHARAQNVANASFAVGDAAVHPFDGAHHDLVFSRFGVMFFAEPIVAFRNIRRALKSTGRLVLLVWRPAQENPWATVPVRAAQPFLPPQPRPPEDVGQFSFGDRARVEHILAEAGFGVPRFEPVDRPIWMGASVADVLAGAGRFGPLARAFAGAEPAAIEKAKQAIGEAIAAHERADGVHLPGACWLVTARPTAG